MKKIFNIAFAAAAMSALAVSCQTENLEPQTPQEEAGMTITINASLSDVTKAAFSDVEGLKWEEGDVVRTCGATNSEDISAAIDESDKSLATFTISSLPSSGNLWLLYNSENQSSTKQEFRKFYSKIEQVSAGAINKDYIQLISETIDLSTLSAEGVIETKMKIVGTLARFLVYSKTGIYASENVQSVELIATDGTQISGTTGALIGYNLETGKYIKNSNAEQSDECVVYYWQDSDKITTTLTNPLSLSGVTEAKQETGIYMAVPPVTVSGYKYVVTTDQATYTFDASSKSCTFKENTVKNVLLNLESAKRVGNDDFKGYVWYEGQPGNQTVSYESGSKNCGYTVAWVSNVDGTEWSKHETAGTDELFYNASYTYWDSDGNEVSEENSWVKVDFDETQICHWHISYTENTESEPRTMKIKGVMNTPTGYKIVTGSNNLTEKVYEYEFTVTQAAYSECKNITIGESNIGDAVSISNEANEYNTVDKSLGYHVLKVNDIPWSTFDSNLSYADEVQALYKACKFEVVDESGNSVNWLQVRYSRDDANDDIVNNTHWEYKVTANDTGAERKAIIKFTIGLPTDKYTTSVPVKEVVITQKAAE